MDDDDDGQAGANDGYDGDDGGQAGAAGATLVTQIATVLMKPCCQSIDFTWANFHASGGGYSQIVSALQADPPTITASTADLPGGIAARYYYKSKTIVMGTGWAPGDAISEMGVVHECTHALQDMNGYPINDDSDASAYLAGAIYYLYFNNGSFILPVTINPIFLAALTVAKQVWHNQGQAVAPSVMQPLTSALASNPH